MTEDLVTVTLVDLPLATHARAQEHTEGLRRELRLLAESLHRDEVDSVPARLVALTQVLQHSYAGFGEAQEDAIEAARRAGHDRLTLTVELPRSAADAARALDAVLDEADEYCRAGEHLLSLATPPDILAYRRWYLAQVVQQVGGAAPVPWHGSAAPPGHPVAPHQPPPEPAAPSASR